VDHDARAVNGVVTQGSDSPYGRFAIVADPFGAAFAVMKLPEA
jgi:predicted enzyme related to lactoylglutathione lyase